MPLRIPEGSAFYGGSDPGRGPVADLVQRQIPALARLLGVQRPGLFQFSRLVQPSMSMLHFLESKQDYRWDEVAVVVPTGVHTSAQLQVPENAIWLVKQCAATMTPVAAVAVTLFMALGLRPRNTLLPALASYPFAPYSRLDLYPGLPVSKGYWFSSPLVLSPGDQILASLYQDTGVASAINLGVYRQEFVQ